MTKFFCSLNSLPSWGTSLWPLIPKHTTNYLNQPWAKMDTGSSSSIWTAPQSMLVGPDSKDKTDTRRTESETPKAFPGASTIYEQKKRIEGKILLTVGKWLFVDFYLTYSKRIQEVFPYYCNCYYYLVIFKVKSLKLESSNKFLLCYQPL